VSQLERNLEPAGLTDARCDRVAGQRAKMPSRSTPFVPFRPLSAPFPTGPLNGLRAGAGQTGNFGRTFQGPGPEQAGNEEQHRRWNGCPPTQQEPDLWNSGGCRFPGASREEPKSCLKSVPSVPGGCGSHSGCGSARAPPRITLSCPTSPASGGQLADTPQRRGKR
jgi:hypothetical protein